MSGERKPIQPVPHDAFYMQNLAMAVAVRGFELAVEQEAEKERMAELAIRDPLTELYNRRHFIERFAELKLAAPSQRSIDSSSHTSHGLILLDIDHFKSVNDSHGHEAGDRVLKNVADIIKQSTRKTDVQARWGGEEFAVLLPSSGSLVAKEKAEEIRQRIEVSSVDGIKVTVSGGLSLITPEIFSPLDEYLRRADLALRYAKRDGRNQIISHSRLTSSELYAQNLRPDPTE